MKAWTYINQHVCLLDSIYQLLKKAYTLGGIAYFQEKKSINLESVLENEKCFV